MIPITLYYGKDETFLKLKLETVKRFVIVRVGRERMNRQNTEDF